MFAIGEYINGQWRYLASRSSVDTFWSTSDFAKAWPFRSVDETRDWLEGIPAERSEALLAKFTRAVGDDGSDAPLEGYDDADTFSVEDMRLAESYRHEPKPQRGTKSPASPAAAGLDFGGER